MVNFDWSVLQVGGTVLDGNEDLDCEHVRSAAGAAWAINYHAAAVWRSALSADRERVRDQLRTDGLGAPPWGIASALVRGMSR